LVPVTGTPAADFDYLTPLRCLKIIAMFRYVLPEKEIIVCGGRQHNLGDLQTMMFLAGASGLMTGNYLTTQGVSLEDDLQLLSRLGLSPRMITK
jgi:biotin synthase